MAKKKHPVHRPHLQPVRQKPEPVKCTWFATTPAYYCERTGYRREHGLQLCDVHYDAAHQDPEDWSARVRRTHD
jgi:hypothetical protein